MELLRFPSRREFSARSIVTFVLTVVITALLWTILSSAPTYAADATWNNGNEILFDDHSYTKADTFSDPTNTIPKNAIVYKTIPQNTNNGLVASASKVFILYFSPGTDPPTATSAQYVEFDYKNDIYSNPQNAQTVTVTPQGPDGDSGSSCSVSGIGWIICPLSNFMADAMDNMFGILASMIAVQPAMLGETNNSMYIAWNIMRTIANVAFVIVFLIIIYAQLTSYGVTNYGLKKLIPRLIIAAVLVNVSYFIAALAIDVSNILGYSVQDLFNIIRDQMPGVTNDSLEGVNTNVWGTVAAAVLGGGGAVLGVYYAAAGGLYLLLPLLLGLLLTVLFVVVILAARQAIIVILVIIAPLAFVANLLPNTEKWFDKWKDLFLTMLIFFPAFSLVFGGSQLAGRIIIQNANGNIIVLIFGLAVQIAPLVITPLLLKLSGGLLGKIAQITNNPRKGILDRSRNWANDRAEHAKQQNIARGPRWKNPASWGSSMVSRQDFQKRRLKDNTEVWKQNATNRYEQTNGYGDIHMRQHEAEMDKKLIHAQLEEHTQKHVLTNTTLLAKDMKIRITEDSVADIKGRLDATYEEIKGGTGMAAARYGAAFAQMETEARDTARTVALNAMRQQSAKRVQSDNLYSELHDNIDTVDGQLLRTYAGGIQRDVGAQRAFAQAIGEKQKSHTEEVTNASAVLTDYNLNAANNLKIALGQKVDNVDINITPDIQEAAIKRVGANGVVPHFEEILRNVDFSKDGNENFRQAFIDSLRTNSVRPKFYGYGTMDAITQGIDGGINEGTIDGWIETMLIDGKLSAKELAGQDRDTLVRVQEALARLKAKDRTDNPAGESLYLGAINNLRNEITAVRGDTDLWNAAGERKTVIDEIEKTINEPKS